MTGAASPFLAPWLSFYAMTGSSAAALTGLMFVVITLVNRTERLRRNPDGIATFSTPTVMHFCVALFVSAVLAAPWPALIYPCITLGLLSLYCVVYIFRVMYRTTRLREYRADLEDWIWYTVLPFLAYLVLLGGAISLPTAPVKALFALAAGAVLLIFIGIRNAWDVVTYIAIGGLDEPRQ